MRGCGASSPVADRRLARPCFSLASLASSAPARMDYARPGKRAARGRAMSDMRAMATGLRFPEGPVAMQDGSVVLVEIERRTVSRVQPDGRVEVIADTGGGPNGLAVGPDGAFYLCNNGGFAWHEESGQLRPIGPSADYTGGRIERVDPRTGAVTRLYDRCGDHKLLGPNDI